MDLLALGASMSILVTVFTVALAFYANAAAGLRVRGRLEGVLAGAASVVEGSAVTPLRETRSVAGLVRFIASGGLLGQMQEDLERADSKLTPGDLIAIRLVFGATLFVLPFLLLGGVTGVLVGLAGFLVGFQLPKIWIGNRRKARSTKLEQQLPEAITLISNSLKAGFGLLQSLSLAAEQLEHPIATELAQAIHEMNVGSRTEEALQALSERTQNYDLDLVVTAILVQRSVGGNLSEILDTVAATMRERVRIRGEITTLTAQQKLTGIVIGLLPVGVGLLFLVMSPGYISVLFTSTIGKVMLGIAVVMEVIGIMIIQRILDIEV